MKNTLLEAFINDVRIEAVKFRLQTSNVLEDVQYNDILGNFENNKQDSATVATILGKALNDLKALNSSGYVRLLARLVKKWNETRIIIQYEGYGWDEESYKRRSEAYSYVLLLRILKKKHKDLYSFIKPLINT